MRTMILTAAAAALLAAAAPAPAATEAPARPAASGQFNSCGYHVTTDNVNLRTGPGTRHASLGLLRADDAVSVDRASGDWYHVTLSSDSAAGHPALTTGWVHKRYLRPNVCMQLD